MLMIRLQRIGRTNDPHFRVVLTDRRNSPKSRNFTELLGTYDARNGKISLNGERIKHWLSKGAKLSPTMHNFLVSEKIIIGKKINVLPRKSPINPPAGGEGTETKTAETSKEPVAAGEEAKIEEITPAV